jgi:hypothetical protein
MIDLMQAIQPNITAGHISIKDIAFGLSSINYAKLVHIQILEYMTRYLTDIQMINNLS